MKIFSHGLHYEDIAAAPGMRDVYDSTPLNTLPEPVKSDILDLPPMESWIDIRDLGAVGDGTADDTDAFKKAIAEYLAFTSTGQSRSQVPSR